MQHLTKLQLSFLFVFFAFSTSAFAQSGTIEGTVLEANNENPLPAINVGLKNTTLGAPTDANGEFTIPKVPSGSYTLYISAIGYKKIQRDITIDKGETKNLTINLEKDILGMNEVVVSATRRIESLDEVPASVNILSDKEIGEQITINSNLNDMLAKQVPGFAQSTESGSNWGQNLRGRDYLVLVNGIPQSTPLRAVSRDLQTIDAGSVHRIEVIKGATAIYGNGATGGLINYITNLPQKNGFQSVSQVGSNISLTAPSNSIGYRFSQQLSGRSDKLSYNIKGSFEEKGLFKDASGDIIPTNPQGQGGLSQASVYNIYGQMGYDINPKQRIEAMYNFYSNDQETEYSTIAGSYPNQKATAVKQDPRGKSQGTQGNHNAQLKYTWLDFWNKTSLDATAYLQDYKTVFGFFSGYKNGGQSYLKSQKLGFRLNLESPFTLSENIDGSLIYGLDLLKDETQQKLFDGRIITPAMDMANYAAYAQLKTILYDDWVFKGGARLESINIDVPSYTTVQKKKPSGGFSGGVDIEGGNLKYSAFTYNLGLSYKKYQAFNPFVSISQGFSIADLGRTLRSATKSTTVQSIDPEPIIVQNYEIGINSSFSIFRGSISGFASTSDLGASYQENNNGALVIARSPEIVYGFEVSAHARPISFLEFGATYSFTEGRSDNNDNGNYTDSKDSFLVNNRISPPKFTAYAQFQFTSKLKSKLSLLHSGKRDRFDNPSGAYQNKVNPYSVLDLNSSYQLPFGSFSIGIENLLNENYYPAISQWAGSYFGTGYSKAPGTRINATLKVKL
ncbi:iron complex outermembrane recepter protein [Fodinibius salinus]|uniref:Iron complex outermembrane recepter protein n=1 Tax=Fodinibius salinus TaxID=860790 RepID=A0A5D3YIV0_9BACT|nr:TonB-dependent receptor [Fodinibius salinus]TYP92170.1 iron complex outermembrane recepter protein [Fodinibius salinus]